MECYCYEFGAWDEPDFYMVKERKARTQHVCCECGEQIKAGQRYEHARTVCDDRWDTYKTCVGCRNLRDSLACGGGYVRGGLDEAVLECFGFRLSEEPSELEGG